MNRPLLAAVALAALMATAVAPAPTAAGGTASVGRSAAENRPAAAYTIRARVNRGSILADQDGVRVTGSVRPRAVGQTVVLQQRIEGRTRWTRTGTAKINRRGSFGVTDFPTTPGIRYYRVVKPASDGIAKGVSRELKVSVWAWRRLALTTPSASRGIYTEDTASFGNVPYPTSILLERPGVPGYGEYTLGRRCSTLRATYALTDSSLTGATGQVSVSADGVVLGVYPLATGTVLRDEYLGLSNAFRIRFDLTASATPSGWSAVGTPEVLCLDR